MTPRRPNALIFALIGVLLGLGAPVGLFVVQYFLYPEQELLGVMGQDLPIYIYVTISTTLVLGLFGSILGRRQDTLFERSERDGVTELLTRAATDRYLEHELERAKRYHEVLSVLLVDIDHLKDINDEFGHQGGDWALRVVARAIRKGIRKSDIAGRYGGDEFMIVAPATNIEAATELAQRIRTAIENYRHEGDGGHHHPKVTVSVGIAHRSKNIETSVDALVQAADKALYRAKEEGRNRVVAEQHLGSRHHAVPPKDSGEAHSP